MRRARLADDERGQTMVEFALVLPILCLLLFAVIQFGILYNNYVTLTDSVRVGARRAAVSRYLGAGATSAVVRAVRLSASNLDQGKLTPVTVTSTWAHGDPVTVRAEYPYSISLLGMVVASGSLTSTTAERVE